MKRRTFLKGISSVAALSLLPSRAEAQSTYNGPLYVFVHAGGAWDPTIFCDPKASNRSVDLKKLKTSKSGSNIKYPDLGTNDYRFSQFFDTYGEKLLIINGINAQTNGHVTGARYAATGRLLDGNPSLSALLAAIHMPKSPLAFMGSGGYAGTKGIVPKISIPSSDTLAQMVSPNVQTFDSTNKAITFYPKNTYESMLSLRQMRMNRLKERQSLESVRRSIAQFSDTHLNRKELKKIMQYMPADMNSHPKRDNEIFTKGRIAIAGYKAGLTVSVNLSIGGFDTHGDNDKSQIKALCRYFEGIDLLMQEAQTQGIENDIVIMMVSEFGRSPNYNSQNGKGHGTTTSYMVMGKGFVGNRVVGHTDDDFNFLKVDPRTLKPNVNGVHITPEHVHKALREKLGIASHPLASKTFPLGPTVETLPLFL